MAADILSICKKHKFQLTNLESKLFNYRFDGAQITFDVDGMERSHPKLQEAVQELRGLGIQANFRDPVEVPWFPASRKDLDKCVEEVIGSGTGGLLAPDHPGFNDKVYQKRREEIAECANSWREGDGRLPYVQYTEDECRVWNAVYEKLEHFHERWACDEFKAVLPELKKEAGFGPKQIPQLGDISEYLSGKTGFRLRPVCGLLSARDFLNALAFKTFCSTQYIRHGGNPLYTPEPDICHELIGHVPMLACSAFAEFTQKVGLASLGASDEEIVKLANIYWFTVEFGVVKSTSKEPDDGGVKVFGAGILSSFGEMEWSSAKNPGEECRAMGGITKHHPHLMRPERKPFTPIEASQQPYPITTCQPLYFVGEDLEDVKKKISTYCDAMPKKFYSVYDPATHLVNPSRAVTRLPRTSTAAQQAQKQREYFDSLSSAPA